MSVLVAPSILSADFGRLAEEVEAVTGAGADWIHIDVMDGHFVPNITMGPAVTGAVRAATSLPLDVHLMIEAPDRYLDAFAAAGAAILTVHLEACPHLHRTLQRIRELGVGTGVAINPATPVEALSEIVPELDLLLIMSVNPGFGGQSFIRDSLDKVRRARALLDSRGSSARLQVDGGVDAHNAAALVSAGADVLVAGSAIYGHAEGPAAGIAALRGAVAGAGSRQA
jgi:ribulose-phosphate 3-epimerase